MTAEIDTAAEAAAAAEFEQHRPLLFAIAYRMLGSAAEAEDAVQDAYLRYRGARGIDNPRAFLSTTISRLCLDRLKSARAQREQYIGPWLPEPVITAGSDPCCQPGHRLELEESVSTAFLLLLESLSPVERAVFLLHEVFDYDYTEIAAMVGQKEDTCRQHVHRAKARLRAERHRFHADPEQGQQIAESFLRAAATGDVQTLMSLVAPDVVVLTDGGGKAAAAPKPIYGAERAIRFLLGLLRKYAEKGMRFELTRANHMPALLVYIDGRLDYIATLVIEDGKIVTMHGVGNPDKLTHVVGA